MLDQFFVYLYPLVTFISISAYIPQIKALISTRTDCKDIALSSWYLWIFSSLISTGYGAFHLKDIMFTVTCAISLISMAAVVGLVLYRRQQWEALQASPA